MGRGLALTFFQRGHTSGQQAHEEMLDIINDQGNGNQNQMRYHLTSVRKTIMKNTENNKCWQGLENGLL